MRISASGSTLGAAEGFRVFVAAEGFRVLPEA